MRRYAEAGRAAMTTRPDHMGAGEPPTAAGRARGRERAWWFDLLVFIGLCTAVTILFAATRLDIASARIFYRANGVDHWPFATKLPWSALYRMAPWITASLVLGGLAAL